jgi:hypothetical protein
MEKFNFRLLQATHIIQQNKDSYLKEERVVSLLCA